MNSKATQESSFDRRRHIVGAIFGPICTSLAFMLPVSTPPNAITYSSGYIPITKMIKAGLILDVIGVFAVTIPLVYFLVKAIMGV